MGVKLQHILGVFLIFQICSTTGNVALSESADAERTDTDVNQIEKLPKTNAKLNNVDQENAQIDQPESNDRTTESIAPGREDNKENVIAQETDDDRDDKARSIDVQKFHNNVYSYPDSFSKPTTNKHPNYSLFELTTPKTLLFDQKYEEARQKLEQEYEENNNSHEQDEESHEAREDEELRMEDLVPESSATLDYKEQMNITKDNVIEKNSKQKSLTIEQVKKVRFTSTFNYDSKEATLKPITYSTEKSVTLIKPTANKNNSYILSNKIESETFKAIPTTEKQKLDDEAEPKEQLLEENKVISVSIATSEASTTEREATTEKQESAEPKEQLISIILSTTEATTTEKETTTAMDASTTTITEGITTISEGFETTNQFSTEEATTTDSGETSTPTTTESFDETTTIYSFNASRVSKGITVEETQSTESMETTTVVSATVNDFTTTEVPITTTTEEAATTVQQQEAATTNETVAPLPATTVELIRVETRNNHTTLVPDTLSPDLSYPTTVSEPPATTVTGMAEESSETAESSLSTEGATAGDPDESNGKVIAIAISSVGAVCLILLAGLLYVMRKRQSRFNYKQRCRPVNLDDYSVDNISVYNSVRRKADRQSKRSYGNPAFEDPVAVTHPLNFPALAKFASNVEDVRAEFEEVPQIAAKTSELPEGCEPKNRYANVIPLPETRVFLRAIDGYPNSDYVNANFVTGPKNTKGYYIATQAPMENTVDDFWRMIWEQQSKVILMITLLFENGVEKSVDYLPPSEVLDCHRLFGDYQVTLKKRDVKEKYVISSLQLKNMVSNSWREITHFWYLGWPEKGVPSEANSLIAFLIEARSFMKSSTLDKNLATNGIANGSSTSEVNPVVVHCSPGTGRTGVVIACDIAIREFEQTRLVDIPKIVYRIRRDRASTVQTKEQYNFIYKVVSLYATKLTGGSLDSF